MHAKVRKQLNLDCRNLLNIAVRDDLRQQVFALTSAKVQQQATQHRVYAQVNRISVTLWSLLQVELG